MDETLLIAVYIANAAVVMPITTIWSYFYIFNRPFHFNDMIGKSTTWMFCWNHIKCFQINRSRKNLNINEIFITAKLIGLETKFQT